MALIAATQSGIKCPEKQHPQSCIYTLYCPENMTLHPGTDCDINTRVKLSGDWKRKICMIRDTRVLYKHNIRVFHDIFDENYRSEIILNVKNTGRFPLYIVKGHPLALMQVGISPDISTNNGIKTVSDKMQRILQLHLSLIAMRLQLSSLLAITILFLASSGQRTGYDYELSSSAKSSCRCSCPNGGGENWSRSSIGRDEEGRRSSAITSSEKNDDPEVFRNDRASIINHARQPNIRDHWINNGYTFKTCERIVQLKDCSGKKPLVRR